MKLRLCFSLCCTVTAEVSPATSSHHWRLRSPPDYTGQGNHLINQLGLFSDDACKFSVYAAGVEKWRTSSCCTYDNETNVGLNGQEQALRDLSKQCVRRGLPPYNTSEWCGVSVEHTVTVKSVSVRGFRPQTDILLEMSPDDGSHWEPRGYLGSLSPGQCYIPTPLHGWRLNFTDCDKPTIEGTKMVLCEVKFFASVDCEGTPLRLLGVPSSWNKTGDGLLHSCEELHGSLQLMLSTEMEVRCMQIQWHSTQAPNLPRCGNISIGHRRPKSEKWQQQTFFPRTQFGSKEGSIMLSSDPETTMTTTRTVTSTTTRTTMSTTMCERSPNQCICKPDWFGTRCEKRRVQFAPHNGKCLSFENEPERLAYCEGIVHASSLDGQRFCTGNRACAEWQAIKDTVHMMWEIEVADLLVDGIGIILTFVVAVTVLPSKLSQRQTAAVASLATVPFLVDLVLESVLITEIGKIGNPLTSLKLSGCFPAGSSYDSIVLLENLAVSSKTLAILNVGIAVLGSISSLVQVVGSCYERNLVNRALWFAAVVDILFSFLELSLGVANIITNTLPFMESLRDLESATLDPTKEEFCYFRNPDLKVTNPAGFQWQTSVHILWMLPTSAALLSMAMSAAFCCCRRTTSPGECVTGEGRKESWHLESDV